MTERGGIEAMLDLLEEAFRGRGIEESDESQALLTNLATRAGRRLAGAAAGRGALDRVDRPPRRGVQDHVRRLRLRCADRSGSRRPRSSRGRTGAAPRDGRRPPGSTTRTAGWWSTSPRWPTTRSSIGRGCTNWGELRPTRWIVAAMITHDAYHAGEINHLRSMLGSDDRWRYIQLGFG